MWVLLYLVLLTPALQHAPQQLMHGTRCAAAGSMGFSCEILTFGLL